MHVQVLSSSVANSLRLSLGGQAAGTVHFCEIFDKFFDRLNASCLDGGSNLFKGPYCSSHDFRLKVYIMCVLLMQQGVMCQNQY